MNRRKIVVSSIILFFVILLAGIQLQSFLAAKKKKPNSSKNIQTERLVMVDTFSLAQHHVNIQAHGKVQAIRKIQLTAEVQGQLLPTSVPLKAGQNFRKSQLLIHIDDFITANNLKALKSDFSKQVASMLPDIKIDYEQNYSAWQDFFNAIDLDKALPQLPKTKSTAEKTFVTNQQVYKTYYNILSEQDRLKKHKIYAPFNGSYSQTTAEVGMNAYANMSLATIIKSDVLEIEIPISTDELKYAFVGQKVHIYNPNNNSHKEGRITRKSDHISASTQSINVYASFKNNEPKLFDGSYVNCTISGSKIDKSYIIPRKALIDNKYVLTLQDNKLIKKEIDVQYKNNEYVYIGGLTEGELIVTENLIRPSYTKNYTGISDTANAKLQRNR